MGIASQALTAFVALLHVCFLVLEMFLWATPLGARTFKHTVQAQRETRVLAANQGLYNGFLAAGLGWSLIATAPSDHALKLFFLGCVVVAGVFGAATVSRTILYVQALPAVAALAVTLLA